MTLQGKLRATRALQGLRQEDLAKRLGVSQGHLSRVEKGLARIDVPFLKQICSELKLNPSEVIGLPLEEPERSTDERAA